jgi:hypothetical protein
MISFVIANSSVAAAKGKISHCCQIIVENTKSTSTDNNRYLSGTLDLGGK